MKRCFQISFPFRIRQALSVADALSATIKKCGKPACLSIKESHKKLKGGTIISITARYEGGTVVKVELIDISLYDENLRDCHEDWVVTQALVRYWDGGEQKKEKHLDYNALNTLQKAGHWRHPYVVDLSSIEGRVCVAHNSGEDTSIVWVNPDKNTDGFFTVRWETSYLRFVEGDLERALTEAKKQR